MSSIALPSPEDYAHLPPLDLNRYSFWFYASASLLEYFCGGRCFLKLHSSSCSYSAAEYANALTYLEFVLLQDVDARELLNAGRENRSGDGVKAFRDHFNRVSLWIATQVIIYSIIYFVKALRVLFFVCLAYYLGLGSEANSLRWSSQANNYSRSYSRASLYASQLQRSPWSFSRIKGITSLSWIFHNWYAMAFLLRCESQIWFTFIEVVVNVACRDWLNCILF